MSKLFATTIANAKPRERPYKMFDGGGLHLFVQAERLEALAPNLTLGSASKRHCPSGNGLTWASRMADALSAGASQRDIAIGLFGSERISTDWCAASDSLRSRVRRLVSRARHMAAGGYRASLGNDETGM